MSKITTKLATLNALREAAGKAPLAGWKNSEAELDQRIKDLTPGNIVATHKVLDPDRTEVLKVLEEAKANSKVKLTLVPPGVSKKAEDKKAAKQAKRAKPATTKASAKATKTKAPRSSNEFGALLTELGLEGKKARAILRKAGFSRPYVDLKAIRATLTKKTK